MVEEIDVENGRNSNFEGLDRDLDLDLRSGHTAYRRASVIDLYLYIPNFMEIGKKISGHLPAAVVNGGGDRC